MKKKKWKAGDKCPQCGTKFQEFEVYCRGAELKKKPMPKILTCMCLHPGDLMCNCGDPCWSMF